MSRVVGSHRARRPRGVSLVELLVAMAGVSVVVTSTAMVIHGAMRAHEESQRFFDDERTSSRLSRAFRADVHAARVLRPAGDGVLLSLAKPDGRVVEYSLSQGATRLERRERKPDGSSGGPSEDYSFQAPLEAAVAVSGTTIRLAIGPDDTRDGPAPTRRKPPAVSVEATLGRDLRFAAATRGEEGR